MALRTDHHPAADQWMQEQPPAGSGTVATAALTTKGFRNVNHFNYLAQHRWLHRRSLYVRPNAFGDSRMDGLSFHDRYCHCRDCLWRRQAERADEDGPQTAQLLEAALVAAECENADVQHHTRIDNWHNVTHRFEFSFAIAGLDVEEERRTRHTIARVFRAIAAELEKPSVSVEGHARS
jgi:hypothetical protein